MLKTWLEFQTSSFPVLTKYISRIWRIVATLTGDQMKGIRGKIRITVGSTSVSDIHNQVTDILTAFELN